MSVRVIAVFPLVLYINLTRAEASFPPSPHLTHRLCTQFHCAFDGGVVEVWLREKVVSPF